MFKSIIFIVSSFIGICIISLLYASPIFKPFPKPDGFYTAGTTIKEFVDKNRREIYSENSEDKRKLIVHFYYPSSSTTGFEKHSYLGDKMSYFQKYIAATNHLPENITKLLFRNIDTHTFTDAPIAVDQKTYPVILFSHGGFGFPSDTYTTILKNLASHGYIVAAIDHPYFNGLTLYKNGQIVTEQKLSHQFNKMNQAEQKVFLTSIINIFNADQQFIIDELVKLNKDQNSIFYEHLDLNRIVAMGHSAGGTASIELCRNDVRCRAAIDLDGWYDHVIGKEPIHKPLLLIFAEKTIEISEPTPKYLQQKELTREQYFEREKNIEDHRKKLCSVPMCSMFVIPGSHSDFGDMMFLKWPFREWYALDPYVTTDLVNKYIIDFLNNNILS